MYITLTVCSCISMDLFVQFRGFGCQSECMMYVSWTISSCVFMGSIMHACMFILSA